MRNVRRKNESCEGLSRRQAQPRTAGPAASRVWGLILGSASGKREGCMQSARSEAAPISRLGNRATCACAPWVRGEKAARRLAWAGFNAVFVAQTPSLFPGCSGVPPEAPVSAGIATAAVPTCQGIKNNRLSIIIRHLNGELAGFWDGSEPPRGGVFARQAKVAGHNREGA